MEAYQKKEEKGLSVELLESLRAGDHAAYGEVYLHYWDSICRFISILIRSDETAKEMTQEIFLKLWMKRDQIDPNKNIKSFLYTIARNEAIKKINHQKVQEKYVSAVSGDSDEDLSADTLTLASEVKLITDAAISNMPKMQRDVIKLFSDEGLNVEEISQRLNISKSSVAVHLYNARKELRKIIPLIIFFISQ